MWALLYWALLALANACLAADENAATVPSVEPHVAVILPLQSTSFGKHADSVRLGILNAAGNSQSGSLKVRVYATNEDPQQVLAAYQRATALGARAVIGPLTRNGVTSLAQSNLVTVPTLALNIPEGDVSLPRDLYVYGLQIEVETRQIAQYAFRHGGTKAFVIAGDSALGGRVAQAFTEEWKKLGAEVTGQFSYTTDSASLAKLREQIVNSRADLVFMSLDATRARFMRSYVGSFTTVYATSMVFTSNTDTLANYDLDGVRFLDMPWLLQPDHPAVISYARTDSQRAALDQERFFALGIDAYRLVQELLRPYEKMETLDGVTGTITLNNSHQFVRTLLPAQFTQGSARLLEGPLAQ
ncbi:MAG TPA: penicillin-binding protein activator [Burkholderiales bacterium]|nr:penicillin-binding protein activator [Burkholderiales bacterium]